MVRRAAASHLGKLAAAMYEVCCPRLEPWAVGVPPVEAHGRCSDPCATVRRGGSFQGGFAAALRIALR
eukprot:6864310-Prymnesium_polylepis.1